MFKLVLYLYLVFAIFNLVVSEEENEVTRSVNARTLLEKITSSFMTRSDGTTSQVLSLNLSNLLILVLLKALIFAAGSIGAGGWKNGNGYGYSHGRSTDEEGERFISDSEILLYLSYLAGSPGKYQCLQNVACNRPQQAIQYAKAGGLLVKAAKFMPSVVDLDPSHEKTLLDLRKAAEYGLNGGKCDEFVCDNNKRK